MHGEGGKAKNFGNSENRSGLNTSVKKRGRFFWAPRKNPVYFENVPLGLEQNFGLSKRLSYNR